MIQRIYLLQKTLEELVDDLINGKQKEDIVTQSMLNKSNYRLKTMKTLSKLTETNADLTLQSIQGEQRFFISEKFLEKNYKKWQQTDAPKQESLPNTDTQGAKFVNGKTG